MSDQSKPAPDAKTASSEDKPAPSGPRPPPRDELPRDLPKKKMMGVTSGCYMS